MADAGRRENYGESIALGSLLAGCVIGKQYRVPDTLVAPIELTSLGKKVAREVSEQNKRLKPNEIRLAVFMHVGCPEGMLFEPTTDLSAMRAAISSEMRASRILFAYIFGRDLHDLAAMKFPEKTHLSNAETLSLLKQLPQGVFQEGWTVTGPLGAIESESYRSIVSRTSVPGYLCSDETCSAVHSIQLETASSAIQKTRGVVDTYIAKNHGGKDDEHTRVIHEHVVSHYDPMFRRPSEGMFDTLADAFSEAEMRAIAEVAVREALKGSGAKSKLSRRFGAVINSPTDYVGSLDPPTLLQVLMTFGNKEIIEAVDSSVKRGSIELAEYEIRTATISRRGDADWAAQVGPLGVRSIAADAVAKRLYALLRTLYYDSQIMEAEDLAYALGVPLEAGQGDLLGEAVRRFTPKRLLEELVLLNRRAASAAADFLDITQVGPEDKEELLQTMLWKLGAPSQVLFTELERMQKSESKLREANERADSQEAIRGHISNLFTAIEDALQRALTYSVWALTTDHFLGSDSYQYDPVPSLASLNYLNEHAPTDNPAIRLQDDGKNTLAPLAAGFGRLAKALRSIEDPIARPADQIPLLCKFEDRPFVTQFELPFANLERSSQDLLVDSLAFVAAQFSDATVVKVRNAIMHGNNEFPSTLEMSLALEKIERARITLAEVGLFPQVFSLATDAMDVFGRREVRYVRGDDSVSLYAPIWPVAAMPFKHTSLVVMNGATMGPAGPLRFAVKARPGSDSYWSGWPKRWRVERAYSPLESAAPNETGPEAVNGLPADVG